MPRERDRSRQDSNDQELRPHRSSSHKHRSHKHGDRSRHRAHRHRHTPYHREKESSTHIYFTGSDNVPSVSLRTDHVALASSLSSLMEQNGGMTKIIASCYKMLDQLRTNQIVNGGSLRQTTLTSSTANGQRGVNLSNLATVARSQKSVEKKEKPR